MLYEAFNEQVQDVFTFGGFKNHEQSFLKQFAVIQGGLNKQLV
jgi:hypothetical protein